MRNILASILLMFTMFFAVPVVAYAADPTDAAKRHACEGISGQVGGSCTPAGSSSLPRVLKGILRILGWIAGIAATIMVIIAGLKYITSGGDSSSIASAKSTLIYALVGLVVVAISEFIVRFVLGNVR